MAYSWNHGPYHFVQLHNGPLYKVPDLGISSSLDWLKADLARAKARGQSVVINTHDPDDMLNSEFQRAIDGMPVVAIFAGHLHASVGQKFVVKTPSGREIPGFLSGSADYQTFLKVDFANLSPNTSSSEVQRQMTVTVMSTRGGQAQPVGQPVMIRAR